MGRGGANQVDEERFSRTCPYLSGCNGNCGARRRARTRDFVVVRASITPRPSPDPFAVHRDRPSGGFFEPAPTAAVLREGLPLGQNARVRAGIEKETEVVTLVSTRHRPPAIPIAPLQLPATFDPEDSRAEPLLRGRVLGKGRLLEPKSPSGRSARQRGGTEKETERVALVCTRHSPRQFPLHPYSPLLYQWETGLT